MVRKERKMKAISMIFIAVILAVIGQIFVKLGLNSLEPIDFSSGLIQTYSRIFLTPFVLVGSFVYFLSIFFWIYSLTKVDLSFAFPFLALSYVLIAVASLVFLGEEISMLRWLGMIIICFGVYLVSKS